MQAVTVYQFEHASGDGKLCSVVVACRAVGVSRSMYYRAQQNPYVKRRIAEEMMTRDMLVGQTISSHWLDVVEAQIRIAMNPENRGSTRAASFLAGLMREHEDRLTDMVMHPTCHGLASD